MNSILSIDLLRRIGNLLDLNQLSEIDLQILLENHICGSVDDYQIRNCLRLRKRKSCFEHTSQKSNCTNCMHSCQSRIYDYVLNIIGTKDLSFNVKFPRLEKFGSKQDRWLPLDQSKCDLMASEAVKLACNRLEHSIGHKYDLESYSNSKIVWSFKDSNYPPPGISISQGYSLRKF